jgi:alpha-1,2-mannosyltransferase
VTQATPTAGPSANLSSRARLWLVAVGLVCGLYGLGAIAIYAIYFGKQPWQDWMVYYTAARAYLDGNLPLIFDGERFTAQINADFAAWLPRPLSFHPWLYPPTYLLLLVPFGRLTFATACLVFLVASFACLLAAIWFAAGSGYRRWLHLGSLAFAPAVAFNIGSGQNAFLTSALLVGGFGLLPGRPRVAGVLLGLLTYKPQLWLLAPVALVASRQWRALAATILTAGCMVLASVAAFGIEPWRVWIEWFIDAPPEIYQTWLQAGRLHGQSIYTDLVLIGVPHPAASAGQMLATLLAAGVAWWCYSRPMPPDLRLAALLAATVLAAPHVTNYDTVLLVVAATLVFAYGLDHGFGRAGVLVPVLVWMIQLFNPPNVYRIGLLTPLLTVLLVACAITRGGADSVASRHRAAARPARSAAD